MTYVYPQGNAYEVIQKEIETNFHSYIGESNESIKNIVIIGASIGNEIVTFLNNYPNATIHAVEAIREVYDVLDNRFSQVSRVITHNKLISSEKGTAQFHILGNGGIESSSILEFQGNQYGHPFNIQQKRILPTFTVQDVTQKQIDLLWVDVQGAELKVLKGTNLDNCKSLFLEIHTHDYVQPWDKEPYKGQCYKEDLEDYLQLFTLHSIGLDNNSGTGQGNSFWIKK